jgi:phage terminase small subunit
MARTTAAAGAGPAPRGGAGTRPLPDPPGWLDEDAEAVWHELAPLTTPGRLTPATVQAFALLSVDVATYREAHGLIAEAGILVAAGASADLLPSPALAIRDRSAAAIIRGLDMFGLLPGTQPAPGDQPIRRPHLVE